MADNDAPSDDEVRGEDQADLFLTAAGNFSPNRSHLIPWLKNKSELRRVVDTFTANLLRVWQMAVVPQAVMHTAVLHDRIFSQATQNILGRPLIQAEDTTESLQAISNEFDRLAAIEPGPNNRPGITFQISHLIHYHKRQLIPGMHNGFSALLGGQIINSLTAFEILAQDLWIKAVNERPKLLGSKKKIWTKWKPSFTLFQRYGFNLKRHMGDLIASEIGWDSYPEMQDAYSLAFEDNSISCVFRTPDLLDLNTIRNALVHDGGVATTRFLDGPRICCHFPDLSPSEPIPLDGKFVLRLTNSAIECGDKLIRGVDSWLDSHQE